MKQNENVNIMKAAESIKEAISSLKFLSVVKVIILYLENIIRKSRNRSNFARNGREGDQAPVPKRASCIYGEIGLFMSPIYQVMAASIDIIRRDNIWR